MRVPAYLTMLVAGWFSSFAGYAYVVWGPEPVMDYEGFSAAQAGVVLGLTVILGGVCGVAVGATLSDYLVRRAPWRRAATIPIGFLIAAPVIHGALHTHDRLHFVILFGLGAFFRPQRAPTARIGDYIVRTARNRALPCATRS